MGIDPKDFEVSTDIIRKRLNLDEDVFVTKYGYEGMLDQKLVDQLKHRYDSGSMFIRTRPDFLILDNNGIYFVEAKQRTKYVEAVQLLFNKFSERCGLKVIYSFPDVNISASLIPMDKVIIPENYRGEFDLNLKYLFENEGRIDFSYIGTIIGASGDAFVPIDRADLKILSDEMIVQESL